MFGLVLGGGWYLDGELGTRQGREDSETTLLQEGRHDRYDVDILSVHIDKCNVNYKEYLICNGCARRTNSQP